MPNFPLSAFRKVGDTVFVSGQIGQIDGVLVSDDIGKQVLQTVRNIEAILEKNGMTLKDIVDVTAFLVDQSDYDAFNTTYAQCFSEPYSTRTTVTVKSLPLGAKVELKAIASK
jgi:2-iminobutanoate/2-iminopropanoate deaminase